MNASNDNRIASAGIRRAVLFVRSGAFNMGVTMSYTNMTTDGLEAVGCQRNWTLLRPRKPKRLGVVEAPSEG